MASDRPAGVVYSCPDCGTDLEDDGGLWCPECERPVPAGEIRAHEALWGDPDVDWAAP
jgi:predicted amidophosphoribosyltransferase